MSTVVANKELIAATVLGDVQAVDHALRSGVSPDCEDVEEHINPWRTRKSLLFLAAEVHSLECIWIVLLSFLSNYIVRSKRRG